MWRMIYSFIFWLQLIEIFQFSQTMFIDCSNGLRQISKHFAVFQIKIGGIISMENPREDRVLRKVIMRSISNDIQVVDVLNVANLPFRPPSG